MKNGQDIANFLKMMGILPNLERVNIYDNFIEVYGIKGKTFPYFEDNHINLEIDSNEDKGFFMGFVHYEEDIDFIECEEVEDYLSEEFDLRNN